MIPIILESPYAGDIQRNKIYLQRAIRDSLYRGEAPFASHQMYIEALSDEIPGERHLGIFAGFGWWDHAKVIIFYIDYGWSVGMQRAFNRCNEYSKPFFQREIGVNP